MRSFIKAALLLLTISAPAHATVATYSYVFSSGQKIVASQINSNFNAIATVVNGGIDQNNIAVNGVATANIVASSITTTKILDGAVTNAKVAANAIDTSNLVNLSVSEAKLATASVATRSIASGSVTQEKRESATTTADAIITVTGINAGSFTSVAGLASTYTVRAERPIYLAIQTGDNSSPGNVTIRTTGDTGPNGQIAIFAGGTNLCNMQIQVGTNQNTNKMALPPGAFSCVIDPLNPGSTYTFQVKALTANSSIYLDFNNLKLIAFEL